MSIGLTSDDLKNIDVAVDEYITRHSLNRNIERLLHNDLQLEQIYRNVLESINISPYSTTRSEPYMYNDLIWFRNENDFSDLYLLRSIMDYNKYSPQIAIDKKDKYGVIDFESYGWSDQNGYLDVLNTTIRKSIARSIAAKLVDHVNDDEYHRFGEINDDPTSPQYYKNKLMLKDLSNQKYPRKTTFYPCQTGYFTDDTVTYGTYSIWDNGLLELDLVFRVGWRPENNLNPDSLYTTLVCNDVQISPTDDTLDDASYNENSKYFASDGDMQIFRQTAGMNSTIGSTIQMNRNDYVNTYSADIHFPTISYAGQTITGFCDRNYMVFTGMTMSQDKNGNSQTISPSSNVMTYTNRTMKSITALLIMFENKDIDASHPPSTTNGLASNTFTCHIVGRWRT